MKNFVGTKPIGFLSPKDNFANKEDVMLDTFVKTTQSDLPDCPDMPLPAPPPCQKYEQYFEPGQKCPSFRLIRDSECPEQTFEQPFEIPTDTDTTSFPNWAKLNCSEVKIALEGLNQTLITSKLGQTELIKYQQQIAIGESILEKNCGKLMETTYTMMNWKSIDCEIIPSAINDLNYMIAQGQGNDADLDLMRKDAIIGEDFYKNNCQKTLETPPGGGLVTIDDLFGQGEIKASETPKLNTPLGSSGLLGIGEPIQTLTSQTANQSDVVSTGSAKKNYTWIYIAAAATAFLLLTQRK